MVLVAPQKFDMNGIDQEVWKKSDKSDKKNMDKYKTIKCRRAKQPTRDMGQDLPGIIWTYGKIEIYDQQ